MTKRFSPSRERSEHLDNALSLGFYPQPTTVLKAREAELARRSRTGATKWYWPPKATGCSFS